MRTKLRVLCVALLLAAVPVAAEEEGSDKKDNKRAKIDERSSEILNEVLAESANAKELFDASIGYAVFDNTKVALGISGGGVQQLRTLDPQLSIIVSWPAGEIVSQTIPNTRFLWPLLDGVYSHK